MKKGHSNPVPPEIQAEIDALAASKEPIRTDLIPEATGDWSEAQRGVFYLKCRVKTLSFTDGMKPDQYRTAKHH